MGDKMVWSWVVWVMEGKVRAIGTMGLMIGGGGMGGRMGVNRGDIR